MLRATTATHWLRSKDLGGMGRDIAVVRQQLGHSDYKSIEAYIALVKNEELAYKEHIANGNVSPNAKA
jgi:integrase